MDTPAPFLSTPSARRATQLLSDRGRRGYNFYPRPPRGGRPTYNSAGLGQKEFLSTPSARRATKEELIADAREHISIHALREEGDHQREHLERTTARFLSTPSARRATDSADRCRAVQPISIHALREEGDVVVAPDERPALVFLSTPSARRATAKTETKSLFSNKLYNILHEFRRALIYNGSKSYPNHAK